MGSVRQKERVKGQKEKIKGKDVWMKKKKKKKRTGAHCEEPRKRNWAAMIISPEVSFVLA